MSTPTSSSAGERPSLTGAETEPLLARMAPLFAAMFFGFMTVSLPLPALPLYVSRTLGFGTAIAGFVVGIQSLATVLTRAYSGRLVDAQGSKATLIRGLALCSVAGWLYLASMLPAGSPTVALIVLVLGRLVLGVGESLLITGVLTWAVVRAGPGRAGLAMSWNGMAQYSALALGAPLGFAVFGKAGFAALGFSTALLPLPACLAIAFLAAPKPPGGTRLPLTSVVGRIWRPGVGLMLAGIGFASVSTFASLDFAHRNWPGAGFALFAYGACFVGLRVFAGHLPDRYGGVRVAAASLATEAVGQLLLWLAPHPAVALVGAGLTGFGCSLIFPALGVEALRRAPPESRGIALGAFAAFQDIAIGITGPVLGAVAAWRSPASVFAVGLLAALAGIAMLRTLQTQRWNTA